MTSRQNLPSRRQNVSAAAQLSTIKSCDRLGRVRSVEVPGHHVYRLVLLSRPDNSVNTIVAECLMQTEIGLIPCKGNGPHSCCYHSLAAARVAAEECGAKVVGWFADQSYAIKSLNLKQFSGCEIGKVVPKTVGRIANRSSVWFLWRKKC